MGKAVRHDMYVALHVYFTVLAGQAELHSSAFSRLTDDADEAGSETGLMISTVSVKSRLTVEISSDYSFLAQFCMKNLYTTAILLKSLSSPASLSPVNIIILSLHVQRLN